MAVTGETALAAPAAWRARADRIYFGVMALFCGVSLLGGFTPTYYLRGTLLPNAPALRPVVVVHGAIFTVWVLLFLTQTALVSARRADLHRRLGLLALGVVPAMLAIGLPLIAGFERGHGAEDAFTLAVHVLGNAGPLSLFVGFALAGLAWRREPAVHKRLMLFATLALQPAGFSRLIGFLGIGQAANVPTFAVLCFSVPLYDLCAERRVRPVSLVGSVALFGLVYVTDILFDYIGPIVA